MTILIVEIFLFFSYLCFFFLHVSFPSPPPPPPQNVYIYISTGNLNKNTKSSSGVLSDINHVHAVIGQGKQWPSNLPSPFPTFSNWTLISFSFPTFPMIKVTGKYPSYGWRQTTSPPREGDFSIYSTHLVDRDKEDLLI